jgi:pyruvate dehydrogenase (quinone)
MLMGELITAHTHQLPLTVVVFNNSSLGMIRLEMMSPATPITRPITVWWTTRPSRLHAACRPAQWTIRPRFFATLSRRRWRTTGHRSSTCAPTRTRSHCRPTITGQQVEGFALASTKTVLDGGVGRMLELAHSNLRNTSRP